MLATLLLLNYSLFSILSAVGGTSVLSHQAVEDKIKVHKGRGMKRAAVDPDSIENPTLFMCYSSAESVSVFPFYYK